MNEAIKAAVASAQMGTDSALRGFRIEVIAVIQDHELYVTKDILDRIVIWAAFRQADPMQLKFTHHLTGLVRFTGVSAVLVKNNPDRDFRIPMPKATQELTDIFSAFAGQKHPMHLSTYGIITHEQVKAPACFLVAQKHQTLGQCVAPSAIGFDRNRFDVEKDETPVGGQVPENPADSSQNCRALGVLTEQLALNPPEAQTVFLTTGANVRVQWTSRYAS
jgi:hypothetical protein